MGSGSHGGPRRGSRGRWNLKEEQVPVRQPGALQVEAGGPCWSLHL